MSKILRVIERLTAERSINKHVINGLLEALKQEKKRRKRGKRLNLLGEEDSGAQFFSPTRIQAAREYQVIKEEDELIKKQGISERKARAAAKKKQKEEDKEKRAAATAERRRIVEETKAAKAAERQAQKELREAAKREKEERARLFEVAKKPPQPRKTTKKQVNRSMTTIDEEEVIEEVRTTLRGRLVHRPKRLDN